jgi:hypothetical protein
MPCCEHRHILIILTRESVMKLTKKAGYKRNRPSLKHFLVKQESTETYLASSALGAGATGA